MAPATRYVAIFCGQVHHFKKSSHNCCCDDGTNNPIIARLGIGLSEIIKMAIISEEKKQKITDGCFEIMRTLIEAEKAAKPVIHEIHAIEKELATVGVKTQRNGTVVETPGVIHIENAKVFLKFAKQALQQLAKVIGIITDKKFDGPHFHKIQSHISSKFGKDHIITRLLEEDKKWLKDL